MLQVALGTVTYPKHQYKPPKNVGNLKPGRTLTAGQRSAILYSLIVSCQRHGKDPLAYLKDLLTRLPRMTNRDDLRPLTPRLWQPAPTQR